MGRPAFSVLGRCAKVSIEVGTRDLQQIRDKGGELSAASSEGGATRGESNFSSKNPE